MNSTLRNGLTAGLISSIILVGLNFVNFEASQSFGVQLGFALLIPIIFMVTAIKAKRNNQEGFISFGEALQTSFLVFMICALIVGVSQFVLYQTFDDDTWNKVVEIQKENAKGIMAMAGADAVTMDEALDKEINLDKIKASMTGIGSFMIGLVGNAFIGLIISLIVSAIMKRNPTP